MADLFIETWGTGSPSVLVHGSLATGTGEWEMQRPLADDGYELHVVDRRGYGRSPAASGEDFLVDGTDIAEVIDATEGGVHLVGHSYGGLGALLAAASRPGAIRSLVLLEPAAFSLARAEGPSGALVSAIRAMWDDAMSDDEWAMRFLRAVGTDVATLPPGVLDELVPLVPLLRRGRSPWEADLPLDELASDSFPKLVVSGGHHAGFDEVCDELADRIGGSRSVIEGAGHEIQFTGEPINRALLALWRRAA